MLRMIFNRVLVGMIVAVGLSACGGASTIVTKTVTSSAASTSSSATTSSAATTATSSAATTTTPATTTATSSAAPGSNLTVSQENAVAAAKQYLQTSAFSKQGLIDQLDSSAGSGYSVSDATLAVDSLTVNWDSQAVQSAKQYLQTSAFSCQGMIQQLSSSAGEGFTQAQAHYGATKVGLCSGSSTPTTSTAPGSNLTVSQQNAIAAAKQYLQTEAFSKQGLIDQLDSSAGDGYSVSDATLAVDSLTVNWDSEAAQSAKQYLQTESFSCQGMIQQLSSSAGEGFTQAQAQYGATKVGLC